MARSLQGTIRRRGEGWQVTVSTGRGSDGRYHRQSFTCSSEEEAKDKLLQLNLAKRRGELAREHPDSLGAFLDDWLAGVVKPNRSGKTYEHYEMIVRNDILPHIGRAKLDRLRPQDVQRFYGELLAAGVSVSMVHHVHRVLRAALSQAVTWGYLPANPAAKLSLPRHETAEMRVLSREETRALLTALHDSDSPAARALWAPVAVAVTTGLRQGELLALKWSDIDLKGAELHVRHTLEEIGGERRLKPPKTRGSRRTVPLHPDTLAIFREHRRSQTEARLRLGNLWTDEGFVFPETTLPRAGDVRSPKALQHAFRREMRRLGFAGLRFHDLRHTHATCLLHAGVNVKDVATRLGHSSPAMTLNVYAHLLPGSQEAAVRALDGLL